MLSTRHLPFRYFLVAFDQNQRFLKRTLILSSLSLRDTRVITEIKHFVTKK